MKSPKVIAHHVHPITNRGRQRWCARLITDGPAGRARNGGALVNKKGEGSVVQGCFGSRTKAEQQLKRFPIGSRWVPRRKRS